MWPPAPPDYWTITRANRERAEALAAFGFTERQARFLVHVLLHAGVFVERQYASSPASPTARRRRTSSPALVERRYATPIVTGALHRGRLYHLHYKPLWAAIGEPDSRFRKPAALGRLIERVMILDAVLAEPDRVWLGPTADKMRFFAAKTQRGRTPEADEYPRLCFGDGRDKGHAVLPGQAANRRHAVRVAPRLPLPGDQALARRLPGLPAAPHGTPARAARVDHPAAGAAAPGQIGLGLSVRRPRAPGDTARAVRRE